MEENEYKLWAVYTPYVESWTREIYDRLQTEINNENYIFSFEIFDSTDPRVALYGWNNFPLFVAVKYNQPAQKIIGKLTWPEYVNWLEGLGWKV